MSEPRILFWDIESTHLNADFGYILCIGYKFAGEEKPTIIRIDDFKKAYKKDCTCDKKVVEAFKKVFETADVHVTWYGGKFDLPMVNSRLVAHGMLPMAPVPHIDLWRTAKYQMKLASNRLANVQRFLGLPSEKTSVDGRVWLKAAAGFKDCLQYIVDHCYADIEVLEQAYDRMRPLIKAHPNLGLLAGKKHCCPVCGSDDVIERGKRVVTASVFQRYQCQSCGSFSSAPFKVNQFGEEVRSGVIR